MSEQVDGEVIYDVEVLDPYADSEVITDIVYKNKKEATIKDLEYMCNFINNTDGCNNCPFTVRGKICGYSMLLKKFQNYENLNSYVLEWILENPPTSFLMDIRTKLPNIQLDSKYNIPNLCVKNIYGNDACDCPNNSNFDVSDMRCRFCWRLPMDKNLQKDMTMN